MRGVDWNYGKQDRIQQWAALKTTFIFRNRLGLADEVNAHPYLSNSIPQSSKSCQTIPRALEG